MPVCAWYFAGSRVSRSLDCTSDWAQSLREFEAPEVEELPGKLPAKMPATWGLEMRHILKYSLAKAAWCMQCNILRLCGWRNKTSVIVNVSMQRHHVSKVFGSAIQKHEKRSIFLQIIWTKPWHAKSCISCFFHFTLVHTWPSCSQTQTNSPMQLTLSMIAGAL